MTKGQHDRTQQASRRKARASGPQTLTAHRVFAPILGIWGAAMAALPVMVLPTSLFAEASQGTGLALLGQMAQPVLAGLGGLALGGGLYMLAAAINRKARRNLHTPSIAAMASRRVHTIDPRRDLGSASLDEPVKSIPFAAAALKHHAEATRAAVTPTASAPAPARAPTPAPALRADMPPPRALDLAEFAELPGRNAVWVQDEPAVTPNVAQPSAAPVAQPLRLAPEPDRRPTPNPTALEQLRAVPANELSIVQMVERFAAALHDHREATQGPAATARDIAAREAALAQALRALAVLSPAAAPTSAAEGEPLRDALTQLHALRGAA